MADNVLWSGRPLDSGEQQTLDKFHDLLAELAMLDNFVGPVDARGLLHHLRVLAEAPRLLEPAAACLCLRAWRV